MVARRCAIRSQNQYGRGFRQAGVLVAIGSWLAAAD